MTVIDFGLVKGADGKNGADGKDGTSISTPTKQGVLFVGDNGGSSSWRQYPCVNSGTLKLGTLNTFGFCKIENNVYKFTLASNVIPNFAVSTTSTDLDPSTSLNVSYDKITFQGSVSSRLATDTTKASTLTATLYRSRIDLQLSLTSSARQSLTGSFGGEGFYLVTFTNLVISQSTS